MTKKSGHLHTSLDEKQGIADYSCVQTCKQRYLWAHNKHTSNNTTGCASHQGRDRYLVCTRPTKYTIDSPSKWLIETYSSLKSGYKIDSRITHLGGTHLVGSSLEVSLDRILLEFFTCLIRILQYTLVRKVSWKFWDRRTATPSPRCMPRIPSFLHVFIMASKALLYTLRPPPLTSSPCNCNRVLATCFLQSKQQILRIGLNANLSRVGYCHLRLCII